MERRLPEGWRWEKIEEVCEINPNIFRPANISSETCISFVPMASVDDSSGKIISPEAKPIGEIWNGYKRFAEGDVLFARITPCMENGKAAIATGLLNGLGTGSTEFHVLRPGKKVLAKWIYYFIRRDAFLKEAAREMTGTAGQRRLPRSFLENARIPLAPLETQRRIVAILDKAEETRRLRVQADKLFREMPLNIFIEIFGDLSKNPNLWEIKKMDDVAEKITDGEHATPIREHEGIYLLSARNIQNHDIALVSRQLLNVG